MILIDVNVLVYAFRRDAPAHAGYNEWLNERVRAREPFGVSELVFSSVVRLLTHPSVFSPPERTENAFAFLDAVRGQPNCVVISPGVRHWEIFRQLCAQANAKGNLVPDAYLAALAIEHGCELITTDRDFARFPGLRWRHPLQKT